MTTLILMYKMFVLNLIVWTKENTISRPKIKVSGKTQNILITLKLEDNSLLKLVALSFH